MEAPYWSVPIESLSHVWLFATPKTVACQAPLFMGFSQQEYWSGLPFPTFILIYLFVRKSFSKYAVVSSNNRLVHEISQARILELVTMSFHPRIKPVSWTARRVCFLGFFFTTKPPWKPLTYTNILLIDHTILRPYICVYVSLFICLHNRAHLSLNSLSFMFTS